MADVYTTATPEERKAILDILRRLTGSPLESDGDIKITIDDKDYVIKSQEGSHGAVKVDR